MINVSGDFDGSTPNLAGVSGANAPYILWNFHHATRIVVDQSDTLEGTIYAPRAELDWYANGNIEGNVIARSFDHLTFASGRTTPREVHDFSFQAVIDCEPTTAPTTEPTTAPTTAPTTRPTTTQTVAGGGFDDNGFYDDSGYYGSGLPDAGGPGGAVLAAGAVTTVVGVLLMLLSGRRTARARSARRTP